MISDSIIKMCQKELPAVGFSDAEVAQVVRNLTELNRFSYLEVDKRNSSIANMAYFSAEAKMIAGKLRASLVRKELLVKKVAISRINTKMLKPTAELIAIESLDESLAGQLTEIDSISEKVMIAEKWHSYLNDVTWCLKDTSKAFGATKNG